MRSGSDNRTILRKLTQNVCYNPDAHARPNGNLSRGGCMHVSRRNNGIALALFAICFTAIVMLALASTTWAAPGGQGTVPTAPRPTSSAGGGDESGGTNNGGGSENGGSTEN